MNIQDYNLWTALVTPLTPGLQVDFESLKNIINEQVQANNGLLILGSTGEALNLSLETKKKIVLFVKELKPTVPLMIGVGGHDLQAQLEWVKWLEKIQIDSYLMVNPIYAKAGTQGQIHWFKSLMDEVTKPVMLYNVPGRAGSELSIEAVKTLKNHPNFWSIKEASGSVEKMKQYLDACDKGKVFCGDDGLMYEFAQAGACGLVSVASNTWPKATNLYVEKCLAHNLEEKQMWSACADSLFIASNPVPAKALLAHEKRIKFDTMMPPLAAQDLQGLKTLVQSSELINNWYKTHK